MTINKVILVGRLGRDPEQSFTKGAGKEVARMSVATGDGDRTEWHNVVAWEKTAAFCNKYLAKGRQVYIEGSLRTRSWDDTKTGTKRYITEIHAFTVQALGDRPQSDQRDTGSRSSKRDDDEGERWMPEQRDPSDDDIPF